MRLCALRTFVVVVLPLAACARLVTATAIPSVYGTGFADIGTQLADTSVDPHYTLITVPDGLGLGSTTFVTDSSKFPLIDHSWLDDNTTSKWISPTADQSIFADARFSSSIYVYRTTFNLNGSDPSTATINGFWATDNDGLNIRINGVNTGITHNSATNGGGLPYQFLSGFTISSGFQAGLNTLDFVVQNAEDPPDVFNPTGLRVQLSGTATPVPEASAVALICIAVGCSCARCTAGRRRR